MNKGNILIKNASEVVTCSGFEAKKGKEMSDLKIISDGAVIIEEGIIKAVDKTDKVLRFFEDKDNYQVIDASGSQFYQDLWILILTLYLEDIELKNFAGD